MATNENNTNATTDSADCPGRVSCRHRIGYGIGHVLNDICASVWFTYLLVYFHLVLGFTPVYGGILLLIGQIADALATPFVGYHSDKRDDFWLCRYGRRKTWHLTGTLCVLLTFPFIFTKCIGCETSHQWAQLVYYAAFIIIFQFGWASVQISHLSLIPDLTPTDSERAILTAIRFSFTVFSNVLVYGLAWAILHATNEGPVDAQIGPQDAHKFQKIVLIGMSVGCLTSFIFHLIVKEIKSTDETDCLKKRDLIPPFDLFKDSNLYKVALIYMPTRLFVNLTQTYIPLYLHETLKMPGTALAIIPLVMYLSSFKSSITINYLNKIMGRKMTYFIGAILGLGACSWIYFGHGDTFKHLFIYPVSLLIGSGGSFMLVTSLSITADYIGHGTENGAFVYGIMSFVDKLFNGIAVMLIQWMRCTQSDCTYYYKDVLVFVCGGAALVGLIMTFLTKSFRTVDRPNVTYSNVEGGETQPTGPTQ